MSLINRVQQVVAEKLSVEVEQVTPEASFTEDLSADSLDLVRLADPGCLKLQCLVQTLLPAVNLRAHRALDDAVALREVCEFVAARLGSSTLSVFEAVARTLDLDASEVHLATLL